MSTVIDAPIDTVWHILRDFNGHDLWHPAIADSQMDDLRPSDAVSGVRRFHLEDGSELSEQLLSLSDREYSFRYCLQDTPVPLHNYVSEVSLKPVTDTNQTYWQWSSQFDTPPGQEDALKELVEQQIYQAGFNAIKTRLGRSQTSTGPSDRDTVTSPAADLVEPIEEVSATTVRYFGMAPPAAEFEDTALAHQPAATGASSTAASGQLLSAPAIVLHRYGGADELRYEQVDVPAPGANEVRIEHRAIGVNYIDIYCRTGYFGFLQPPGVLGMEAAGVVVDKGDEVDRIQVGDRIAYAAPPVGAYAKVRNISQESVVKIPPRMTFNTAAAVMLKGMTVEFLLHQVYPLQAGDSILVHAAAGGVGTMLCQWAKTKGATVIGTVSTEEKAQFAQSNGCHHPIIYSREDFPSRVREITAGRGVDAVFDAVGRKTFGKSVESIRDGGHVISFGQADEPLGQWDIGAFAARSLTLSRPNFGHYTDTPEKIHSICNNLFHAIENNIVRAHIGQQYSLAHAAEAHRAIEGRKTMGATILIPE